MSRTNHKPRKGIYKLPKHSKYKGSHDPVYRSSWELQMCKWCDTNPNVKYWMSEGTVIPYISKVDGKMHRYFPDFYVKTTKGDIFLIEIKPKQQTNPPKKSKSRNKYLREVKTWSINQAKWEAAKIICEKHGWMWRIWTEREINPHKYSKGLR